MDNIEKYKVAKKTAKRAVNVAKGRAYEDLYQHLSTKEGEKDNYRMTKVRERKTRDFNQVDEPCYKAMGESYRASLESNNTGLCEPI